MKLSQLKSIIRECIEEITLNESLDKYGVDIDKSKTKIKNKWPYVYPHVVKKEKPKKKITNERGPGDPNSITGRGNIKVKPITPISKQKPVIKKSGVGK